MEIYNSLSRNKEDLIPIKDKKIKMYSCGLTVYDHFHIGNARSFITTDVIKKYLKYKGCDNHGQTKE